MVEGGLQKWRVPPDLTYLARGLVYMFPRILPAACTFARFRAVNIFTKFGVRLEGYS